MFEDNIFINIINNVECYAFVDNTFITYLFTAFILSSSFYLGSLLVCQHDVNNIEKARVHGLAKNNREFYFLFNLIF